MSASSKPSSALRALANEAGMSMATMAMSWVLSNPAITAPIVGASRPEQLADSLAAAEQGHCRPSSRPGSTRSPTTGARWTPNADAGPACAATAGATPPGAMTGVEFEFARVRDQLATERRGAAGGYTGFADDRFFQSDPHMHLFEAGCWRSLLVDLRRWRALAYEVAAAKAVMLYFDTPIAGLWRDKLLADGSWIDEPAPASSFYHIIDALRVLAVRPADPMLDDTESKREENRHESSQDKRDRARGAGRRPVQGSRDGAAGVDRRAVRCAPT